MTKEVIIEKIRWKLRNQNKEFNDSQEEVRVMIERLNLKWKEVLEEEHKKKIEWIRLYCKEIGIIKDPLDDIFVDVHKEE